MGLFQKLREAWTGRQADPERDSAAPRIGEETEHPTSLSSDHDRLVECIDRIIGPAVIARPAQALLVLSDIRADAALGTELIYHELLASWPPHETPPPPPLVVERIRTICSSPSLSASLSDKEALVRLIDLTRLAVIRNPAAAAAMWEEDHSHWLSERVRLLLEDNPVEIDIDTLAVRIGLSEQNRSMVDLPFKGVGATVRAIINGPFMTRGHLYLVRSVDPNEKYPSRPRLSLSPVEKHSFTMSGVSALAVEPRDQPDYAARRRGLMLQDEEAG